MKIGFIFISIISMALVWLTLNKTGRADKNQDVRQKLKTAMQSLLAGVIVYFLLLLVALAYMATGHTS